MINFENKIKKMLIIIMGSICFMAGMKMMQMEEFWGAIFFDMIGVAVMWVFLDLARSGRTMVIDGDELPEDIKKSILKKLRKLDTEDCGDPECEIHGAKKD